MDEFKRFNDDKDENEDTRNNNSSENSGKNYFDDVIETTIIKSELKDDLHKEIPINVDDAYSNDQHCFEEKIKNDKKNKKRNFTWKKMVACVLVAILIGGGFQFGMQVTKPFIDKHISPMLTSNTRNSEEFSFDDNDPKITDSLKEVSNYTKSINNNYVSPVVAIADNMKPSIVTITSTITTIDWFNNERLQEGTGSGIIFAENDEDIYIVTNQHVIENSKNVIVTFFNSENIKAQVIGYDVEYDLAVLAIDKKDINDELENSIRIAKLGNSDELKVGELAVAIGNPLGKQFSHTVTVGYVSALNRTLDFTDSRATFIQTDAAINPGNSGGALVNAQSEVIGINSCKLADTDIEGMGFAIPINEAKPIIEDIVNQKDRPALGIKGIDVTEEIGKYYGLPIGILIKEVTEGSGAEKGGLQPQDIIFEFGGVTIFGFEDLQKELEKYEVGDTVAVKVSRQSGEGFKKVELQIKLTDRRSIM
ncbi:serine protease Do-like HtrB [Vallitalea longa]|uniref:Serine protease Do-like HtrB n=1 Tax=Vallitalea longa TaxID=2936439 RepID=A0A9W6DI02_9FIRM|nr:trypsin-like peptidase domain-containing protein [Vallitalea longa]GKX32117.1 serine protease Do-like HtrB [Vallitalea longa]